MYKWDKEKENLTYLIIDKELAYEEIGKMYNCSGANIKKQALKLNIPLKQRRKINSLETFNKKEDSKCLDCNSIIAYNRKYCNKKCQQSHLNKLFIIRWKEGDEDGMRGDNGISNYIRNWLLEKNKHKCQLCGWDKLNPITNKVPLTVHQIDRDATNNLENTLELLCPNCHSLTDTYCNLNKNSTRKLR